VLKCVVILLHIKNIKPNNTLVNKNPFIFKFPSFENNTGKNENKNFLKNGN
jgi:hypothetical protein